MSPIILQRVSEAIAPNRYDAYVYRDSAEKGVNALMSWLMEMGHVDLYDRLDAILREGE